MSFVCVCSRGVLGVHCEIKNLNEEEMCAGKKKARYGEQKLAHKWIVKAAPAGGSEKFPGQTGFSNFHEN